MDLLRNPDVIMDALAELLTVDPGEVPWDLL